MAKTQAILAFVALVAVCSLVCEAQMVLPLKNPPPKPIQTKRVGEDTVALPGSIALEAEFYVQVALGTPAQNLYVQVDTGSSDLLVFSSDCSDCPSSPTYDYYTSSTSEVGLCTDDYDFNCQNCYSFDGDSACGFLDQYGDGSEVEGPVIIDEMGIGLISHVKVSFGIIEQATSGFEPYPVSGIWGLAYQDLSDWEGTPAFDQIVDQTGIYNSFSMCLENLAGVTTDAGYMDLGVDYSTDDSFAWTPVVEQLYYSVTVEDFGIDGVSLGYGSTTLSSPMAIVDSGTTLLLIPTSVYNAFVAQLQTGCTLQGACGTDNIFDGNCVSMTTTQLDAYPSVYITLADIVTPFVLESTDYLIPYQGFYCMGIGDSNGDGTLLGDVFMQPWHVVFDRQQAAVGFGDISTCPVSSTTASLVGQTSSFAGSDGAIITPHAFGVLTAVVVAILTVKLM